MASIGGYSLYNHKLFVGEHLLRLPSADRRPDKPSFTKWLGQESAADKSGGEQSRVMSGPARFAHCTRFRHFAPVAEACGCSPKRG